MRLLMITRKVDRYDPLAGFAYSWVKKISQNLEKLIVLCLERGETVGLPENVEIYSLGKESGVSRFQRVLKFQQLAIKLVPKIDGVFCHMNPEYTIAIWPYTKIFRKKIVSWYTHGTVTWKTRFLEKLANKILTASKESFRLSSKKLIITGHGIDIDFFKPISPGQESISQTTLEARQETPLGDFKILSIGRISPTKDYETLIKAIDILVNKKDIKRLQVNIVGGPGLPEHQSYFETIKTLVKNLNLEKYINFWGAISNTKTVGHYQDADLFINLSSTGSVDKAVLEAMACGCLILTSNVSFKNILGDDFMVNQNDFRGLAEKIIWIMNLSGLEKERFKDRFKEEIIVHHNLDNLAKRIVEEFKRN